jgi:hypothetical protein
LAQAPIGVQSTTIMGSLCGCFRSCGAARVLCGYSARSGRNTGTLSPA